MNPSEVCNYIQTNILFKGAVEKKKPVPHTKVLTQGKLTIVGPELYSFGVRQFPNAYSLGLCVQRGDEEQSEEQQEFEKMWSELEAKANECLQELGHPHVSKVLTENEMGKVFNARLLGFGSVECDIHDEEGNEVPVKHVLEQAFMCTPVIELTGIFVPHQNGKGPSLQMRVVEMRVRDVEKQQRTRLL